MYERLLAERTWIELEKTGGLLPAQFSFVSGKSTVDALGCVKTWIDSCRAVTWRTRKTPLLVLLDICNPFNSIPWAAIMDEIERREISPYIKVVLNSYLRERGTDGN